MQHMPRESRPFLGPNLYITPPGRYASTRCVSRKQPKNAARERLRREVRTTSIRGPVLYVPLLQESRRILRSSCVIDCELGMIPGVVLEVDQYCCMMRCQVSTLFVPINRLFSVADRHWYNTGWP